MRIKSIPNEYLNDFYDLINTCNNIKFLILNLTCKYVKDFNRYYFDLLADYATAYSKYRLIEKKILKDIGESEYLYTLYDKIYIED